MNPTEPHLSTSDVYGDFHQRLRAFIALRVHESDVDDVLQEVFLRVHGSLGGLRDQRRLTGWLFQIARNAIHDQHRSRGRSRDLTRQVQQTAEREHQAAARPAPDADAAEAQAALGQCLQPLAAGLPAHYREALELVEWGQLSQTAAAARLGLSVSGMKSRVQRARLQLRGLLGEMCRVQLNHNSDVLDCQPREQPGAQPGHSCASPESSC